MRNISTAQGNRGIEAGNAIRLRRSRMPESSQEDSFVAAKSYKSTGFVDQLYRTYLLGQGCYFIPFLQVLSEGNWILQHLPTGETFKSELAVH